MTNKGMIPFHLLCALTHADSEDWLLVKLFVAFCCTICSILTVILQAGGRGEATKRKIQEGKETQGQGIVRFVVKAKKRKNKA